MLRGLGFLGLLALAVACGSREDAEFPPQLQAVATGSPVATAWTRALLADTGIEILPIHVDSGPAGTTAPPRERVATARLARLVVLHGAGFEAWARQVALPPSRTRVLAAGQEDQFLEVEERTHAHGAQGAHTHRGIEPHTWLDPALAAAQQRELARLLGASFPEQAASIEAQAAELLATQDRALQELGKRAAELRATRLLALHGQGAGYRVRAWGGTAVEVELDLSTRLGTAAWNRLRAQLGPDGGLLLCDREPAAALREQLLAELKLVCVVLASGADGEAAANWLTQEAAAPAAVVAGLDALLARRAAE